MCYVELEVKQAKCPKWLKTYLCLLFTVTAYHTPPLRLLWVQKLSHVILHHDFACWHNETDIVFLVFQWRSTCSGILCILWLSWHFCWKRLHENTTCCTPCWFLRGSEKIVVDKIYGTQSVWISWSLHWSFFFLSFEKRTGIAKKLSQYIAIWVCSWKEDSSIAKLKILKVYSIILRLYKPSAYFRTTFYRIISTPFLHKYTKNH